MTNQLAVHKATGTVVVVREAYTDHTGVRQVRFAKLTDQGADVWDFTEPEADFTFYRAQAELLRFEILGESVLEDARRQIALIDQARVQRDADRAAKDAKREAAAKRLAKSGPCDRCGGTGYIREYSHIHNGECFACNGLGA